MNILKPVDIENEIRKALTDYITVYCRPLPEKFTVPSVLVAVSGGDSRSTIDRFTVTLQSRAEEDADAYELLSVAIGLLEKQVQNQAGALRNVEINSLGSWGSDPVRPDLKLATATVIVTAHRENFTIPES